MTDKSQKITENPPVAAPVFRTAYSPHLDVAIEFRDESLTKQAFKEECDINTIMKRYEGTGLIDHVNTYQGQYGDFTDVPVDYQTALNIVIAAENAFDTLPAELRKKFDNDPGAFVEFVDKAPRDELAALGLLSDNTPTPQPDPSPKTKIEAGDPAE